jgi:hypothetical protein
MFLSTLDDAIRAELTSFRDSYFHWLLACTLVVLAGVVLEEFDSFSIGKPKLDSISGILVPRYTLIAWKKRIGRIGWLLIIIGVLGEGVFEYAGSTADGILQQFNDILLTEARKEAGDAKTSAEGAATASSRAQASADTATLSAGKAQTVAGAVASKAEELDRQLAVAKKQLEAVEAKRAELEKSLINLAICNAPRVIGNWFLTGMGSVVIGVPPGQIAGLGDVPTSSYVDSLRPMAGQIVFIEVVPDAEARRAALNIKRALDDAGWDVHKPMRFVDGIADGVSVQPSLLPLTGLTNDDVRRYWHVGDVADKLLAFLHLHNWQAVRGWPLDQQGKPIHDETVLPAGAIRIQVGLYPPAVYVSPPGQKKLISRLEEMKREGDNEWKRIREMQLNAVSPEVRERMRQADEEWDAKMKSKISNNPCQVLNPLF